MRNVRFLQKCSVGLVREGVRWEGRVRVQVVEQVLKNLKDQFPANVVAVSFSSSFSNFLFGASHVLYTLL